MIVCPLCRSDSKVLESRVHANAMRRKRACLKCDHRWTTYEVSAAFMSMASELPAMIQALLPIADNIRQAVDDYDLHAFGETDTVGRHKAVQAKQPSCPKCHDTMVFPIADDRFKKPRMRCAACEYEGTELAFKRKRD